MKKYIISLVLFLHFFTTSAQSFSLLGSGTSGPITELFADTINHYLLTGGEFIGGRAPSWNGSEWTDTYSRRLVGGTGIFDYSYFKNKLYAAGNLGMWTHDSVMFSASLLNWNGNEWIEIGDSTYALGYDLYADSNYLYVCGAFERIAGIQSHKIAKYDGTNWYSFPPLDTVEGWGIYNAMEYQGELYVGGNFDSQIATNMKDLAKWNGTSWEAVSDGLSGPNSWVNDFTLYHGDLIVAGRFQTAWGDPGNCIAAWDGNTWKQLGTGASYTQIVAVQVYQDELYVGGQIEYAGNIPVSFIAKWDGTNWHNTGLDFNNVVKDFAILDGDLYIAGGFVQVNGADANYIVRYNPTTSTSNGIEIDTHILLFPNPVQEKLSVLLSEEIAAKTTEIGISDITGKEIYHCPVTVFHQHPIDIATENLSQGVYFLSLTTHNKTYIKRFVKE